MLAKNELKMGKIPIFTPLEGSEGVNQQKKKCQAPQNTQIEPFLLCAYYWKTRFRPTFDTQNLRDG